MSFALPGNADSDAGLNAGLMGVGAFLIAIMANTGTSGGFQVILYGLLLEAGRRVFTWLYARLLLRPRVSATFLEGDPSYEWILHYLTERGIWKTSRDFTVNTKSTKRRFAVNASMKKASNKRNVDLVPTWQAPHLFRWQGYWVDVSRATSDEMEYSSEHGYRSMQALKLQFFTLDAEVITRFVDEARGIYENANCENVTIHSSINAEYRSATWRGAKSKTKRSLDSIALPEGVLSSILEDIREFIDIEDWYKDAGIPHHRGYLLWGPPGTGKTSSVYAIAGELGLEIYALSLADSHVDDAYLQDIAAAVPQNSILLIEDIDCAFPSREDEEDEENSSAARRESRSKVTLSGILNLMDGVASDDGRIIIATTNYYERLDPALVRPGRIDVKVEYKKATSEQAAALFNRFFPATRFSTSNKDASPSTSTHHYVRKTPLSRSLPELCQAFASALPKDEFTTAELQGYLLKCKWDPEQAVEKLGAWVEELREEAKQRAAREEEAKTKRRRAKRKAAKKAAKETAKAAAGDTSTSSDSDVQT